MLYDREEAIKFLGSICNNLDLIRDRNYDLNPSDFEDNLHKIIFIAANNLALEKDISQVDGFVINSFLKQNPVEQQKFEQLNGVQRVNEFKEICRNCSVDYAYKTIRKFSLLRRYEMIGMDVTGIYDEHTLDPVKLTTQRIDLDKMSIDEIKHYFKLKIIEIDEEFQTKTDIYSFSAGDEIEDLIKRCEEGEHWGVSFQSLYYNAIFKGMNGGKYMLRSGTTGSGKSRLSIGDMCNIACSERYIPEFQKWIENKNPQDVVFISTELTKDEVHLAMLSTISGVGEEIIKDGKYSPEQKLRIVKAAKILKESKIHCVYNSDFSISFIENVIEKYIIRNNAKFIFFDYIQVTASLSRELIGLFGYALREDQMLNQLSTALKNLANKYNVFILSSTQLNRTYKFDSYLDATHLRGGQATLDKADFGIIVVKATKADLEKLQPIIEEGFKNTPTHGHHIIKNRGGKWNGVIVWTCSDLDTINCKDCFVTTQDFEYIPNINPVQLI